MSLERRSRWCFSFSWCSSSCWSLAQNLCTVSWRRNDVTLLYRWRKMEVSQEYQRDCKRIHKFTLYQSGGNGTRHHFNRSVWTTQSTRWQTASRKSTPGHFAQWHHGTENERKTKGCRFSNTASNVHQFSFFFPPLWVPAVRCNQCCSRWLAGCLILCISMHY